MKTDINEWKRCGYCKVLLEDRRTLQKTQNNHNNHRLSKLSPKPLVQSIGKSRLIPPPLVVGNENSYNTPSIYK